MSSPAQRILETATARAPQKSRDTVRQKATRAQGGSTPGDRVIWVVTKPDRFEWGVRDRWIGSAKVPVSDPERTFLDCLHLPRHAGGITEVAAALLRAGRRSTRIA